MIDADVAEDLAALNVPRETWSVLEHFVALLDSASRSQNLISPASRADIWRRHIIDSLQLLSHSRSGLWIDVGTGAGFPGLIVAIVSRSPIVLVEPRRLRVAFLSEMIETLGLGGHASIHHGKVETFARKNAAIISARAVAPLGELFAAAHHLAGHDTVWLLPKGRSAQRELVEAKRTWQGVFELVPSMTDPEAAILVARRVERKANR